MNVQVGDKRESKVSGKSVVVEVLGVQAHYAIGRKLGFRQEVSSCEVVNLSSGRVLRGFSPDRLGRKLAD